MMKQTLLFILVLCLGVQLGFAQTRSVPLVPESFSVVFSASAVEEADGLKFPTVGTRNGNTCILKDAFDPVGTDVYVKWYVGNNPTWAHMGFDQTSVKLQQTPYLNSALKGKWVYTRISVAADYSYEIVSCSGNYDNQGGTQLISPTAGVVPEEDRPQLENTTFYFRFWDTYDATAYLKIGELIVPDHSGEQLLEASVFDFENEAIPVDMTVGGTASVVAGGSDSNFAFYMQGDASASDYIEFPANGADLITFDVKINHSNSYKIKALVDGVYSQELSVYYAGSTSYAPEWCEATIPVQNNSVIRIEFSDSRDNQDLYLDNIRFYEKSTPQTTLNMADVTVDENTALNTILETAVLSNAGGLSYDLEVNSLSTRGEALLGFDGDNLIVNENIDFEFTGTTMTDVFAFLSTEDVLPLVYTTFDVTVNDVNDTPVVEADQVFSFDEKSAAGTILGTVAFFDDDAGDVPVLSFSNGNDAGFFEIDPTTGELSVVNGFIDYAEYPQFSLTVRATDEGDETIYGEAAVTVNVNDVLFAGGTGVESDPFQIKTAQDLDDIRNYLGSAHSDKFFELMNDVDLQEYLSDGNPGYNGGALWEPIGFDYNNSFRGSLNGNGYSILNLEINRSAENYVGLFGQMVGAEISQLNVDVASAGAVAGNLYVGALCGLVDYNSSIDGVNVSGQISGQDSYVGGLTGAINSGSVQGCSASVSVSSLTTYAGGLVGKSFGVLTGCSSEGEVSGDSYVGGLVGSTDVNLFMGYNGSVSESYSLANVSAVSGIAGGLVGYNLGVVSKSYATGTVVGPADIGGLVGQNAQAERSGMMMPEMVTGSLANSYSASVVSGTGATIGGLVGSGLGTTTNSYWDTNASGQTSSSAGNPLNGIEIRDATSFSEWDFADVWNIEASQEYASYPYLVNNENTPHPGRIGVITISSWPEASDIVYGQTVGESTLSNGIALHESNPVAGSFQFVNGENAHIVGSYEEAVVFLPDDEANYLPALDGSTTLVVNKKPLSVINAMASDKDYDGNKDAVVSGAGLEGVEGSDEVVLEGHQTGTFEQAPAGVDLQVTTNMTISGADASNYLLEQPDLTATINKVTLTATADNKERLYGEANPVFTVSYSGFVNDEDKSVLDVEVEASATATSLNGVGDYPITLSGGEAQNYTFNYVPGTLKINRATLTATADDKLLYYGDPVSGLSVTYSDFVNDEDPSVLNSDVEISTLATDGSPVGEYEITLAGGDADNYQFNYVDGTLNIQEATITVTPVDVERVYGESNPELTFTYSGFVNGEDESVLISGASATTSATPESPVAGYDINLSGAEAGNYVFDYFPGTLQVNPAPLTVRAFDVARAAGEPNPVLEMEYSGFLNGDNISDIDVLPVASCVADEFSPAGEYDITVSGGEDDNYYFVYDENVGILTVTTVTGFSEKMQEHFSVYPIPAENHVFVSWIEAENIDFIQLIDMTGRVVKSDYQKLSDNTCRLDLNEIKSGIYFLTISSGVKKEVEKIIVK